MSSPGPPASTDQMGDGPSSQPPPHPDPPPAPISPPEPYQAPEPPPPRLPLRSRLRLPTDRRALLALALAGMVIVAAAVVWIARANSGPPASTQGPLKLNNDVAIRANPAKGGCDTTFTFVATGTVTGTGRMTYRWEQSDGRTTPVLAIIVDRTVGSFSLHQSWRIEGSQQVDGAMTFRVLSPTPRASTAKISYSCS